MSIASDKLARGRLEGMRRQPTKQMNSSPEMATNAPTGVKSNM